MVDVFDSTKRSDIMRRIRSQNSSPEMVVRKIAFSLGFRYRLHSNKLPGKPDLVFPKYQKVIFVHGCFSHLHTCRAGHIPSSNIGYWQPKLIGNAQRNVINRKKLQELGWKFMVIWQCELKNPDDVRRRIEIFLREDMASETDRQ